MLRDAELDVATLLEAAGVGSMAASPPTLYAGRFPSDTPAQLVAVRDTGGDEPDDYVGTSSAVFRPTVQVLVRATRKEDARKLAARCFEALYLVRTQAYTRVKPDGSNPVAQQPDANGRHVYTFNVSLEYSAAVTEGELVPLPNAGPLVVSSLTVEGDASVGGLLRRPATHQRGVPGTEFTADTPLGTLLAPAGAAVVLVNNPLVRTDSLVRAWMMNPPTSFPAATVAGAYVTQPGQFAIAMTDTSSTADFVIGWEVLS